MFSPILIFPASFFEYEAAFNSLLAGVTHALYLILRELQQCWSTACIKAICKSRRVFLGYFMQFAMAA